MEANLASIAPGGRGVCALSLSCAYPTQGRAILFLERDPVTRAMTTSICPSENGFVR